MVLVSLLGGGTTSPLAGAGTAPYAPTMKQVQDMAPREWSGDTLLPSETQPAEEWTETVRIEDFGAGTFTNTVGSSTFGRKTFTLPANPGTEIIEVIIQFDERDDQV